MRIAIIENEIVVNVIEADEKFAKSLKAEYIIEDESTGLAFIGGDLKDGKFRAPMPDNALEWNDSNWSWTLKPEITNETTSK